MKKTESFREMKQKKSFRENFILTNILCSIRTKTLLTIFSIFVVFFGIILGIIIGVFSDTYFQYEGNLKIYKILIQTEPVNGMFEKIKKFLNNILQEPSGKTIK